MEKQEPLTESYYYILLCLSKEPLHGYGIMQEALRLSENAVKIGSGTMYGASSNMRKKGWIKEIECTDGDRKGKRLYELTTHGREVLQKEIIRLNRLLKGAKELGIYEEGL